MADSILYRIFRSHRTTRFLLYFTIILIIVNKSFSHNTDNNRYNDVGYSLYNDRDFALCRQCGADIVDSEDIINHLSPEALIRSNQTLFGRPKTEVQLLINPLGVQFYIFTTAIAKCISVDSHWNDIYSWFPGYAWKLCFCNQCGTHLGWMFEPLKTATKDRSSPSKEGFYGLILESVISETFSNSLLVVPKLYRNK